MCGSSPITTSSPAKPAARAAWAARRPASEAPTMTRRSMGSALDADGHHRADVHGLFDRGAPLLGDVGLPDQDVVVAELEHVGRREDALAVALAEVHVRSEERRVGKECRSRWS